MSSLDLPFLVDTPVFNNYAVSTRPQHAYYFFQMHSIQLLGPPPSRSKFPIFHEPCATPQIFKTWFWMGHWSHPTPKRTLLWGNTRAIAYFWRGRMTKKQRNSLRKKNKVKGFSPVKKYRDGKGRLRFHGTSALTQTQNLGSMV